MFDSFRSKLAATAVFLFPLSVFYTFSEIFFLNIFLNIKVLKIFLVLFLHYLVETKLGVPLLTMIRFDPDLQDILELDFAKGVLHKIFLSR